MVSARPARAIPPARRSPRGALRPLHTTDRRACSACHRGWRSPGRCRDRPYTPAAPGTPVPDPRSRCCRLPRADQTSVPGVRSSRRTAEWAAVAAITAGAAVLRLVHIGQVPPDPFYDAAVRSMEMSWHNFFFGAYEPGGSVSIDKPPIDLWLQVISVKALGFSSTTLKLPEALAGIASVPLLYVTVRRIWSAAAGIAAAVAIAVMPIAVITARSDTMDGVMMLALVLALFAAVRASETGRGAWLFAMAAALGVAFDVKLLESLVAVPGIALFAYLGLPGRRVKRVMRMALAGAVYVAVALSWLTATLLFPAHDRPYAIGSTNGSAWNAAFVFNGSDRLGGKQQELGAVEFEANHHYAVATQEQRDHIPIGPPSPTRLLATVGPLSGERLGLEILAALLLGIPALLWGLRGDHLTNGEQERERSAAELQRRMRRAAAGGLSLWMLVGIVLFSHQIRLHPRYVEAFTPAVAAMLGIGLAWVASPQGDRRWDGVRLGTLIVSLAIIVYYGERLLYGYPIEWWLTLLAALAAIACALLARLPRLSARVRWLLTPTGVIAMALVAVLVIPLKADSTAITDGVGDGGRLADRARRTPDTRPDHIRWARLHLGGQAQATDRGRQGALRLPEHLLCRPGAGGQSRLLGPGKVGAGTRNRRLEAGRPATRRVVVPAAGGKAMSEDSQQRTLQALADGARASGKLALDTEFMGEGRYRTLLCLIQLAVAEDAGIAEHIAVIDPLDEALDGAPLADVLADPEIQIVVHAGRQDIALVRRRFETEVSNVFDTQVAAGFAGLGAQLSYDSLLAEVLGMRVAKTASFTRWDARPLSNEQLGYAREDVVHLLELAGELERRLAELGRLRWAQEECAPLARSSDERDLEAIFARLPRVRTLSGSARPVARELVQWRERTAARQNRPVQSVLGDATLMEIAKRRPSSRGEQIGRAHV